jgi:platelet-activating factor acetylhydrolase IB subunit beta/gamma
MSENILDPIMRTDDHFLKKHESFLNQNKNDGFDVLFLGDSITRRWEDNIDLWNTYFLKYKACNFGVGQDCIQNVKWRILNGELDGINPKLAIILIGTNNLDKNSKIEIVLLVKDIISITREKLPNTKIVLLGIFPRCEDDKRLSYMKSIKKINSRLKKVYRFTNISFYDVGKVVFIDKRQINTNLLEDGIHPNRQGYQKLGPYLQKIIDKYY